MTNAQIYVRCLRDEQHGHCHIDGYAIHIKGKAAREHRPDNLFEQPIVSSLIIARGIMASPDVVLKAISNSSLK